MGDLNTERTPFTIAAEINVIKQQTGKILLGGAIEVGRCLKEAKELVPRGEWLKWLEQSVNYTEKTAQNLMRIFDAYGSRQLTSPEEKDESVPDLNYTQALLLLGVSEEERVRLITKLDLESMSTRQLEKAIRECKRAATEREQALLDNAELRKAVESQESQADLLSEKLNDLKKRNEELSRAKVKEEEKTERLSMELKSQRETTSAKAMERMGRQLTAAYHKAKANRINFLYESMERSFRELRYELKEFAAQEPETYDVYRDKIMNFLTKGMKEKL